MVYTSWLNTGRPILKYDEFGNEIDIHPTDLVEIDEDDIEMCLNCSGEGCHICDYEGYIDYSEPNGVN